MSIVMLQYVMSNRMPSVSHSFALDTYRCSNAVGNGLGVLSFVSTICHSVVNVCLKDCLNSEMQTILSYLNIL